MVNPIDLIELITMSKKREEILLSLKCGPMSLTEINEMLGVKSPESLPQLTRMVDSNLIYRDDDRIYHLTKKGGVLVNMYMPLYNTIQVFESFEGFFDSHDTSTIPDELLDRLGELKECRLVQSDDCDICESHPEFDENVKYSLRIKGATCIFIHSWVDSFLELVCRGVPIELILTNRVYSKIKREYPSKFEKLLKNGAHIYVCDKFNSSFITTDQFFSFSLDFIGSKTHDTKNDLQSSDPVAIKWGEDLFEYYKNRAKEVINCVNAPTHIDTENEIIEFDIS